MDEKLRIQKLSEVFYAIYHGKYGLQVIRQNQEYIEAVKPLDIIKLVDMLVRNNVPLPGLKTGISKFLGVVNKPLLSREIPVPGSGSVLECCLKNNKELDNLLQATRPLIKQINDDPFNQIVREELSVRFFDLGKFGSYYLIKENVLFPLIEKHWKDHRCVKVMWSLHDDIRKDLQEINELLKVENFDLPRFNQLAGDIFFNMYAIRFREERILFPVIQETIPDDIINSFLPECVDIGFPYFNPELPKLANDILGQNNPGMVDLKSGSLTPEQIILIFNHLPVDITYVDENDQVKFFSTPPDRIFPRSNAIIGRNVRNCHPPESVHVVEQILDAFRKGERDSATFWINVKEETVLIQYFACRDKKGKYKGVVEVSQVISGIQELTGEKRLLDWKK